MLRNCFRTTGLKACVTAGLVAMAISESSQAQLRMHAQPFLDGQNLIDALRSSHAPAVGGGVDSAGTGLIAAANNVVALQCPTGGWNWPYGGCAATYTNITGPIGIGLLQAYAATGNVAYRNSAVSGANRDMTDTWTYGGTKFGSFEPGFYVKLSAVTGNPAYSNDAKVNFFDRLAAGTYGDVSGNSCGPTPWYPGDTHSYIARHKCLRSGVQINLRPWDMLYMPWAAGLLGNSDSAPGDGISQQQAFLNEEILDGLNNLDAVNPGVTPSYYGEIIGLAGAVNALALNNTTSFPPINSPLYAGINGKSTLCELADYLASLQDVSGAWMWTSNVNTVSDQDTQTTAYCVLALIAAENAGCGPYTTQIANGRAWMWTMQDPSDGGFYDYPGGPKNIETNSEVMSALALPATLTLNSGVCHTDGTVTVTIDMSDLAVNAVGGQFFLQYDNSKLSFVSATPGGAPFDNEVFESVNAGAGTIDYAVGVTGGGMGTSSASTMVVLNFNALQQVCSTANLVTFRSHTPPTQLTDNLGQPILPALNDLGAITIDNTVPMITCPGNTTIECDESTAPENTGMASATDNCDGNPTITYVDSSPILVMPSNLGAWSLFATGSYTNTPGGDGVADFVNGPAMPPMGAGSAHLNTGTNGEQSAQMRNNAWAGTRLDQLTALGYSTFVTSWNGAQVPYLTIWIDTDGDNVSDDRLWFEPTYSDGGYGNGNPYPQPPVALNVWQNWNALHGMWYSDNVGGPGADAFQLTSYIAMFPNAKIVNDGAVGGIRIASGFATDTDVYNCYVDAFTIGTNAGTTQYNFELSAPSCGNYLINRTWMATDDCGNESSCVQTISVVDSTPPMITCPGNVGPVNADAGNCTAVVSVGTATATDNCDMNPTITGVRSDMLALNDPYPVGTTTITWTATDACGNSSQCMQTVTVNGSNTMLVDLQLAGSFTTTFTRCIRFELSSGGPGVTTVNQDVTFTNGFAIGVPVEVPCGAYTCVTARDTKHTLRRTDSGFSIVGTNYAANFTGGDALVGGNLNDDAWIDILDFGIFVGQFGTSPGADTMCGYAGPHADINGNGNVDSLDFNFISLNFLQGNEANCMGVAGLAPGNQLMIQSDKNGPITRISVKELIRRGMNNVTAGDVNHDGWVDQADVAAFLNSH